MTKIYRVTVWKDGGGNYWFTLQKTRKFFGVCLPWRNVQPECQPTYEKAVELIKDDKYIQYNKRKDVAV